jgi:hypothetical protein
MSVALKAPAPIATALLIPVLWSAPTAHADEDFDAYYMLKGGAGMTSGHLHITGNGGDLSRPTGTLTNGYGCVIETFISVGATRFATGHVVSETVRTAETVPR